jgi:hypothetical protein
MPPSITRGRKLPSFRRRFGPGRMPFEQWISCRLGFDISLPKNLRRNETTVVKLPIRTTPPTCNIQGEQTIERWLIHTLHLVERTIPRFRLRGREPHKGRGTSHLLQRLPGTSAEFTSAPQVWAPRTSRGATNGLTANAWRCCDIAAHHNLPTLKAAKVQIVGRATAAIVIIT